MLKTLNTIDHQNSKCAEIYCGDKQQFSITCCYCYLKTVVYEEFLTHFQDMHGELIEKPDKEEEQPLDFGIRTQENTNAEVLNVKEAQYFEEVVQQQNKTTNKQSSDDEEMEIPLASLNRLVNKAQKTPKQSTRKIPLHQPQCPLCGIRKNNKYNLQSHINSHTGARPYRCERCGNHFTNSGNLWKHIELVHKGNRTHQCTHCDKKFQFQSQAKRHELRVHLKVRPYACTACESAYFTQQELQEHTQLRHACAASAEGGNKQKDISDEAPPSNYVCEFCGKSFVKYSSIWSHRRVVHSAAPDQRYVCTVCSKPLHTAYHLREHMNTHTDDRPHACAVCGKAFQQKKFLRDHARIHSGIKAFACHICGKKFTQAAGLYCHAKTHRQICD